MDRIINGRMFHKTFEGNFYDGQFLSEYGRVESLRAQRYNNKFSIMLVDIEGLEPGVDMGVDGEQQRFLKRLVAVILETVRTCDVVGLIDEGQIAAIMPQTDYIGALMTIRKLSKACEPILADEPYKLLFAHADFPRDGRGFGELVTAATRKITEKKESLWVSRGFGDKLFWQIMGELAGTSTGGGNYAAFDTGEGYAMTEFFMDQVNDVIVRESARSPRKKGIVYFASKKLTTNLPFIKTIIEAGSTNTKMFLVGETDDNLWDIKNATPLLLDDPRLKDVFFTFFFNEDISYALICRENWGSTFSCFHTSDAGMVEGLITKFQNEYYLQEQLG